MRMHTGGCAGGRCAGASERGWTKSVSGTAAFIAAAGLGWSALSADLPRLTASAGDNSTVVVTWPATAEGFRVERTEVLSPGAGWLDVQGTVTATGGTNRLVLPRSATTQFYRLRRDVDIAGLLLEYARKLAEDNALQGSWKDAYPDVPFLDALEPRTARSVAWVTASPEGSPLLAPGLSEGLLQSYCVKMGTPSPGGGTGFLPLPWIGPRADIVARVATSAVTYPQGTQEDRQILLWAIMSRTPVSALPPAVRELAAKVLSAADLLRLDAAVAGRREIEQVYSARIVDAYLGPGGILANLPAGFRDALMQGGELERALLNSAVLSYEDMQQLAFTGSLINEPIEPGREIPYGRWAWVITSTNPPAGYLARYLVGTYDETLVQFYRGEALTVGEDSLGRIRAVEDAMGNRVEVTYDDAVAPLTFPGDPSMKGYALGNIRFVGPPDPLDPRVLPSRVYSGGGWVLVGTPTAGGSGAPVAGAPARYREGAERYAWAVAHRAELVRLESEFDRWMPGRPTGPATTIDRLMRLGEWCECLRLALLEIVPEDDADLALLADRQGLGYRAWASVLTGLATGRATVDRVGGQLAGDLANKRWTSPDAQLIWDQAMDRLSPGGSGQDIAVARAKREAAAADARAAWSDYKKWTGRLTDAVTHLGSWTGAEMPWTLPLKVVQPIMDTTVDLWIRAGFELAKLDPPRSDFTVIAQPLTPDPGPLPVGGGVSPQRQAAAETLLPVHLRLGALMHACVTTYDRIGGAFQAGDRTWALRQAVVLAALETQAGRAMLDEADALETWLHVLQDEGAEDLSITPADVSALRQEWRTRGFPAEKVAAFRQFGLTDAEIEAWRQAAANLEIPTEEYGLFAALADEIVALRETGRRLLAIGVTMPSAP